MITGLRNWFRNLKINKLFASYDKKAKVLDKVQEIRSQIDDLSLKSGNIRDDLKNNSYDLDGAAKKASEAILYDLMIIELYGDIDRLMKTVE